MARPRATARIKYNNCFAVIIPPHIPIKAIVAATKELISAIAAGNWVAVLAIVMICLIGFVAASPFGIFFAGSNSDDDAESVFAAVAVI